MVKSLSSEEKAEWTKRLEAQAKSGQSMAAWCHSNQIPVNKFYHWRKKLASPLLNRSEFLELAPPLRSGLKIECKGITIELDPQFDSMTLRRCLTLLKEMPC